MKTQTLGPPRRPSTVTPRQAPAGCWVGSAGVALGWGAEEPENQDVTQPLQRPTIKSYIQIQVVSSA